MRPASLLLSGLLAVPRLQAEEVPGRALPLFNAYLAQAALTVTADRTDLRIGDETKGPEPGRLTGESAYLGPFTYRPKTYAELSQAERALLVHDPQFHAFLVARGRHTPPPPDPKIDRTAPKVDFHCEISPEEMLRSRLFVIVLPP
jgi:hypothetical protein